MDGGNDEMNCPYRAEYAKSGRASCKSCKMSIEKGILRLAIMVQSPMFDGKTPHWYHVRCFFSRARPKSMDEFAHSSSLRWEDQESLRKMITDVASGSVIINTKGKGGKAANASNSQLSVRGTRMDDFRVELAKSTSAMCRVCEIKIKAGLPRIGKKDYNSQRAQMYGPYDMWHHVKCFAARRVDLEYFDSGSSLSGFMTLSSDDRVMVTDTLPPISKRKPDEAAGIGNQANQKKIKVDNHSDDAVHRKALERDMKRLYYYRDMLAANLKKKEIEDWLVRNGQDLASGVDKLLDRLADCMAFGAPLRCTECNDGQFVFQGHRYICCGNLSEWTKCQATSLAPNRRPFVLPSGAADKYEFAALYNAKVAVRTLPVQPKSEAEVSASKSASVTRDVTNVIGETGHEEDATISRRLLLRNMTFYLDGNCKSEEDLSDILVQLGATVSKSITKLTCAVICTDDAVKRNVAAVKKAVAAQLPILGVQFVRSLAKPADVKTEHSQPAKDDAVGAFKFDFDLVAHATEHALMPVTEQCLEKLRLAHLANRPGKTKDDAFIDKKAATSVKLQVKGGAYVDPESGLENKAHVLKTHKLASKKGTTNDASRPSGANYFSVVLGSVDIQQGRNSYYKLQLLQHDRKEKYFVFRSWGRVGTTIGGTKLEKYGPGELAAAKENFEQLFAEKTGNRWSVYRQGNFAKVANRMYPLDMTLGGTDDTISGDGTAATDQQGLQSYDPEASKSTLALAVRRLLSLIFDVQLMKQTLAEFEIDLRKMPLGKLSRRQILDAYSILSDVQSLIGDHTDKENTVADGTGDASSTTVKAEPPPTPVVVSGNGTVSVQSRLLDASNRFFTLIPHDFGMASPPLLDSPAYVKSKIEMLDNLLEMELAVKLLNESADAGDASSEKSMSNDPFDRHYRKLRTHIEPLDDASKEYGLLTTYVGNTHASSHDAYTIEVENIFKVVRKGERTQFEGRKTLGNRMLLWHGSRTTNFAGILSRGLRIAPPEAPVTGYMFGKGIYFADLVSKSANYCNATPSANTGLLLLCDVALGTAHHCTKAKYIEKLPAGCNSVKGWGKTEPDPAHFATIGGCRVPLGKPVTVTRSETDADAAIAAKAAKKSALLYNEYIVYDPAQVQLRYLLRVKFHFKQSQKTQG